MEQSDERWQYTVRLAVAADLVAVAGDGVIITSVMVRIARSGLSGNTIFFEQPYDLDKVVSSIRQLAAA
jgi:hypothetical protein